MDSKRILCGVAVNLQGEARACYLHPKMSMAAYRYWQAHNQRNDIVVRREINTTIKVYKMLGGPSETEESFMFSVNSTKLQEWDAAQVKA